MPKTLDMQFIRYLNLLERVSEVRADHCFIYNTFIIYAVPKERVSKAIGEEGKNVKRVSRILVRKVKIVASPSGIEEAEKFINSLK